MDLPLPVLPDDLINDILLRLPVKSLMRFRSVCKQWNYMLTASSFVRKHYHHQSNPTRLLAYWCGTVSIWDSRVPFDCWTSKVTSHEIGGFTLLPIKYPEVASQEVPNTNYLQLPGKVHALRGPCNGIYCLQGMGRLFCLWNPATKRLRPLPHPPPAKLSALGSIHFGFGLLEDTTATSIHDDDFKVVLLCSGQSFGGGISKGFSVYSSKDDSWKYRQQKSLRDSRSVILPNHSQRTTFLNECYYWKKYNMDNGITKILEFDFRNEAFYEMEMPEDDRYNIRVGELEIYDGYLALFSFKKGYRIVDPFGDRQCIKIWVMKERRHWTKLFSVTPPLAFDSTLGFLNRDSILVRSLKFGKLVAYDFESGNVTNLKVEKIECALRNLEIDEFQRTCTEKVWALNYKESLVSVKFGHDDLRDYDAQSTISRDFLGRKKWLELH